MIVANRPAHLVMEGVQVGAGRQMQDQELSVRLQEANHLPKGRGLVAKVGKGVETEDDIESLVQRLFFADVEQEPFGLEVAPARLGEHGRREIGRDDPPWPDGLGQPARDLPGAAADLQHRLARAKAEPPPELFQAAQRGDRIRPVPVPVRRLTVEEGDSGIRGGRELGRGMFHTKLCLNDTRRTITSDAMNVLSVRQRGQAGVPRFGVLAMVTPSLLPLVLAWLAGDRLPIRAETHAALQAVQADGTSAWSGAFPFTLRGVLLCDPDEMLNPTPNFLPWDGGANQFRMGAEWQVTLQAVEPGDRGGTTCWMGQNYGNQPWIHDSEWSYTNEAWVAEILRLNFDPSSLHAFRAGDLVEATVRQALFYGGKRNINEGHDIAPDFNFDFRLVTAGHGLPAPEVITLADVMNPGGDPADAKSWPALFDPSRATGGELYQGTRVRLNNLTLLSTNGWNPELSWGARLCTVTDGAGRYFSLRHPRRSLGPPPTGLLDVIGIFNQESGSGSQGTNGYELFVQQVIPHTPTPELAIGLNLTISRPASSEPYELEWRSEADSGDWTPVTQAPVLIQGMSTVVLPPSSPQRYYRLRKANGDHP